MRLVREGVELERTTWNFRVAANNERLVNWLTDAYRVPATWVPNLYHLDHTASATRDHYKGGTLRIGAFGATRPLKNFMTAAGAAVADLAQNARRRRTLDVFRTQRRRRLRQ